MEHKPESKNVAPPNITPADLASIALQLASRSAIKLPEYHFKPAFFLLSSAARYLENPKSIKERVSRVYGDSPPEQWTFDAATSNGGPLCGLWKSRQGLEQAVKRLASKLRKDASFRDASKRWLAERKLTALDMSLLVRAVKMERCGELDAGDESRRTEEIISSIPRRKTRSKRVR